MDDIVERFKQRMAELNLTRADIDRATKLPVGSTREFLDRKSKPTVDRLAAFASSVGYTLQQLYDGVGHVRLFLNVDGITRGQGMWAKVADRHARVVPITLLSEDTVTVEISGDDAAPSLGLRRGDLASGQKILGPNLSNIVGTECIVRTVAGDQLMGVVLAGSKPTTYNVRPFDHRKSEARDVAIEWAAPIQIIVRGLG